MWFSFHCSNLTTARGKSYFATPDISFVKHASTCIQTQKEINLTSCNEGKEEFYNSSTKALGLAQKLLHCSATILSDNQYTTLMTTSRSLSSFYTFYTLYGGANDPLRSSLERAVLERASIGASHPDLLNIKYRQCFEIILVLTWQQLAWLRTNASSLQVAQQTRSFPGHMFLQDLQ